jgi:hypothetical protein
MADVLRSERDGYYRYRLTETDRGFLISMRTSREAGTWIASEWLHQNREVAEAGLEAVKAFNAAWCAFEAGLPNDALLRQAEALSSAHHRLCEQFNDHPLVGEEVRILRETMEPDS